MRHAASHKGSRLSATKPCLASSGNPSHASAPKAKASIAPPIHKALRGRQAAAMLKAAAASASSATRLCNSAMAQTPETMDKPATTLTTRLALTSSSASEKGKIIATRATSLGTTTTGLPRDLTHSPVTWPGCRQATHPSAADSPSAKPVNTRHKRRNPRLSKYCPTRKNTSNAGSNKRLMRQLLAGSADARVEITAARIKTPSARVIGDFQALGESALAATAPAKANTSRGKSPGSGKQNPAR